jgi:hypothetical protein
MIKTLNSSLPDSYDVSYTHLSNHGSPLEPMLLFENLEITKNSFSLFQAKKIGIGFPLSFNLMLGHMEVSALQVEDAFIVYEQLNQQSRFPLKLRPSKEIFIDIKEFIVSNVESKIVINGQLKSLLPSKANGYFNITHGEQVSNLSISSDGITSNFLINFKEFNWLKFSPVKLYAPLRSMNMGVSLIGSIGSQGSFIEGTLKYQETNFGDFEVQKNYGSFIFQSKHHEAELFLNKFFQPFIGEQYPIRFNLKSKSIIVPEIFLNEMVVKQKKPKFSSIALENLVLSFDNGSVKYSSKVTDLDLLDLYFSEILNLKGGISGIDNEINFSIASSQSLLKDAIGSYQPITINAQGSLINRVFNLKSQISELTGELNLILNLYLDQKKPIELKVSGKNVSKNIILTSIPNSFTTIKSFIAANIKLGEQNNIFLYYSGPDKNQKKNLVIKLDTENLGFTSSPNLNFTFTKNILEIQNNNLYFFAAPGIFNNFPISSIAASLNFSKELLRYSSAHDFSNKDTQRLLNNSALAESDIAAKGLSKGYFNLATKKHLNLLSISAQNYNIPLYQTHVLNSEDTQIFISNFNQLNGLMNGKIFDQNIPISFHGNNLLGSYELDFIGEILLSPRDLIPKSALFELSGDDTFLLKLSINKNDSPVLTLSSNLNGIEFTSDYSFLRKSKSRIMPTQISISNFSKPKIYLVNELVELQLNSLQDLQGYISIGQKLPSEFAYLKQAKRLNFYLGLDELTSKMIQNWPLSKVTPKNTLINKFIFDIQNLEIFSNHYDKVVGIFSIEGDTFSGNIKSSNLDAIIRQDDSGFLKLELNNSRIQDASFLSQKSNSSDMLDLNARLIINNSSLGDLQIQSLDMYLVKNKNLLTFNKVHLKSNLLSISPRSGEENAYFSIDNRGELYKLRGSFTIKDSSRIPIVQNFANFSYFNGNVNLQWKNLQKLQNIEGSLEFILKDLLVENKTSTSVAFTLLGVLNLKNILGKVANLDLTLSEFTSTQLNRIEGDFIFNQSQARLASPMFIETNAAKMKWIGQINKNQSGELNELDLDLDLRVRIGENIPWYAAVLGGLPAIAGSAVISEIFETNIDSLSNYQYKVSGALSEPKIQRVN